MKRQPTARLPPRHAQQGFLLPELAIAVLVGAVVLAYVGGRYWQGVVDKSRDDSARMVGTQLATVNDSTKTYATTFFTQIQRGQSVSRNGYTLAPERLLSPTLADLNGLGFLPSRALAPVVYNGQAISYRIDLQVDTQSGCTVPTCNLLFQVTTSAPLLLPGQQAEVDVRRATLAATTASPANAGVSLPASMGGDPAVFVAKGGNPIGTNVGGVAGLVAIRNGYDSSGFMEFDRRDGSLPRTGDINMQDSSGAKHNINNAATVSADAAVTGTLQVTGLAAEGDACTQVGLIAANSRGKLLGCDGRIWGKATDMPNAHRYLFTESTQWTVPDGVKSALVTMAGGGASGYGWRFSGQYATGSSGGFIFSAPVNLKAGEKITVQVGLGGRGVNTIMTNRPVTGYPNYRVFTNPTDDDGLGGYPGESTKLISPSDGVLLECAGGSGAYAGGVDDFAGTPVPGNVPGARAFSGFPNYPSPNRRAAGNYTNPDGPGACGPNNYGVGNPGNISWQAISGVYSGGTTPFGYGSGGSIYITGCYVHETVMGTCINSYPGRGGVVMIDVLY